MVKGYRRNAVFIKNTNSDIFDMAYFILKDDKDFRGSDIIGEANRILEENTAREKRRTGVPFWLYVFLSFLWGISVGIGLGVLFFV